MSSERPALLFSLGGEHYAMDLQAVEAILPDRSLAAIPLQPSCLEGFFEHEGECLPVLSLHRLLGVPQLSERLAAKVIVLRHRGFRVAFRADAVLGAREVEESREAPSLEVDGQSFLWLTPESLFPEETAGAAREAG